MDPLFILCVEINFKRSESIRFRYISFNASMFDKMPKPPVFFLLSMILITLGVLRLLIYIELFHQKFSEYSLYFLQWMLL